MLTMCGLPAALSVIVIVPDLAPVAVGVNVTLVVQFAPAATGVPQVLVWAYCALAAMLVTLSAALPVLLSVTDCAALVVFSSWLPKLKFVADKLTMGAGAAPVPVRLMVCGLPAMLSVIVTAPVRMPVAVGVNVTLMVQLAPAATDVPQVLVCMKSPLATMLVTLSATFPVLFSVTDCATLVVFRF